MGGDSSTFVIIGASLTGAKAAESLRAEGFNGRIVLIGEESELPYERPPLSKGYLLGNDPKESAYVHPAEWYSTHRIELRLGTRVEALDARGHRIRCSTGEEISYDKLLLATGSLVSTLDTPGAHASNVYSLRRFADSERIKAVISEQKKLLIIGAGWIGLEVAAAARINGCTVTVVEGGQLPLRRVLGDELAAVFRDLHIEHGVDFRFGVRVQEFRTNRDDAGAELVTGAVLTDGSALEADAVVVGIGITPATELAEAAGLEVSNGVLVDAGLKTSAADIYASGDIANMDHPVLGQRIRVEHWANALHGGEAAGKAMLGQPVRYDRLPYFFSDQYDLGMEYVGYHAPGEYDEVVIRGNSEKREFIAFWLRDGVVLAGMNVNVWDVVDDVQALIGHTIDQKRLADTSIPLSELR